MLSSLLRPFRVTRKLGDNEGHEDHEHDEDAEQVPKFPTRNMAPEYGQQRHATADFTEADDDDDEEESSNRDQPGYRSGARAEEDEDGLPQSAGVLPLFITGHLGNS